MHKRIEGPVLYLDFDGVLHPDAAYWINGQIVLRCEGRSLFEWAADLWACGLATIRLDLFAGPSQLSSGLAWVDPRPQELGSSIPCDALSELPTSSRKIEPQWPLGF